MNPPVPAAQRRVPSLLRWVLALAACGVPASLLWDYSWESTIGIDRPWAPPHVATFAAVALAALAAMLQAVQSTRGRSGGVRLWKWRAPLGAWIVLWGAAAFFVALPFDRWWQLSYGLVAGIWHPPQLLKAAAFFAITTGAWLVSCGEEKGCASSFAAGSIVALIFLVTLPEHFANRQHSAPFYLIACATYPMVLISSAIAGPTRFSATAVALVATGIGAVLVWLLPLIPGSPQVAPIYHPRDHLLPPPFPPLLVVPALVIDALLRLFPGRSARPLGWSSAVEVGLIFFAVFLAVQWPFARFLLSPAADHWFFAGGGKHWPFFLRIDPPAKTAFWYRPADELTVARSLGAAALAVGAARLGLWLGEWMKRVQR